MDKRIENTFLADGGEKTAYRAHMRDWPYPEKVKIVVGLQKIVAPILRSRGQQVFVWSLDDEKID